jgi:hypothetical protein
MCEGGTRAAIATTRIFGGPVICFRKMFIIFNSVTDQIAESRRLRSVPSDPDGALGIIEGDQEREHKSKYGESGSFVLVESGRKLVLEEMTYRTISGEGGKRIQKPRNSLHICLDEIYENHFSNAPRDSIKAGQDRPRPRPRGALAVATATWKSGVKLSENRN